MEHLKRAPLRGFVSTERIYSSSAFFRLFPPPSAGIPPNSKMPYCTLLYIILYYIMLYYIILYYSILSCSTLYYIILYCIILYYIILSYSLKIKFLVIGEAHKAMPMRVNVETMQYFSKHLCKTPTVYEKTIVKV